MQKNIIIFLVLLFNSSSILSSDISKYPIDDMIIGDSLLDHLTEKKIIENFQADFDVFVQTSKVSKNYDLITISYLKNDTNYIMQEISARTVIKYDDCLDKQKLIVKEIEKIFPNGVAKDDRGINPYRGDPSGESKIYVINFYFVSGGLIHTGCYNFSKNMDVTDFINIATSSDIWLEWNITGAFD